MALRISSAFLIACVSLLWATEARAQAVHVLRTVGAELSHEFSSVDGIRELRDGRVLVVDARERGVRLADFHAGTVVSIGRDGSGPGEYRAPISIFPAPGDSSIIFDGGQTRLLYADAAGRLGRIQSSADVGASSGALTRFVPRQGDARGRLYATESAIRQTAQGVTLADSSAILRWDRNRTALVPLAYVRGRSLEDRGGAIGGPSAIPFVVGDQWAVAPDGRVAIVRWDTYRVELIGQGGQRVVGPVVPVEPIRVTPAIRDAWRSQQAPGVPEPPRWPEFLPPFPTRAAIFAPNGDLWVRRNGPAQSLPLYDVFDQFARRILRVQLDAPGDVVGFGQAHVLIARVDEDGLQFLRRAALP
jgi:hypothetical protein